MSAMAILQQPFRPGRSARFPCADCCATQPGDPRRKIRFVLGKSVVMHSSTVFQQSTQKRKAPESIRLRRLRGLGCELFFVASGATVRFRKSRLS